MYINKKTILLTTMIVASSAATSQELGDDVFAVVNGAEISMTAINLVLGANQLEPQQQDEVLQRLVANMIVAQEALSKGLDKNPQVQAELELTRMQLLARAYIQDLLAANPIDETQIKSKYDEVATQLTGRQEYKAFHILVDSEDDAKELVTAIDGNFEKFKEAAQDRSIDTVSAAVGGDLDWGPAETYVPEFAQALQALAPGEFTSAPVQTQFGWHLIYLEDKRPIELPALDDQQRQQLTEVIRNELITNEYDRLVSQADVVINESLGQ